MYYGNGMQRYRETDIGTMSPEKIIVKLYERTVRDLEQAGDALAAGDRREVNRLVIHSQAIVGELRKALNHDVGGDVAANLESIYDWLFRQHLVLLTDPTPQLVADCVKVLAPLADAWRSVATGAGTRTLEAAASGAGNATPSANPGHVRDYADRSTLSLTV
ncbi:MAG TPA: flagellar protein FliS [Candidatus Krumholzibacteria bacterium]|nr:flagellar protein FliS [Candidatus Krumholzibacteria bacterium]